MQADLEKSMKNLIIISLGVLVLRRTKFVEEFKKAYQDTAAGQSYPTTKPKPDPEKVRIKGVDY